MVREDILGGLKNALERGDSLQEAKASFLSAGYSKNDVEEAAASLEKVQIQTKREIPVPTIFSVSLEKPEMKGKAEETSKEGKEEIKPFPQIKVKRKFNYWLLIPIIIISFAIAYLIFNLLILS